MAKDLLVEDLEVAAEATEATTDKAPRAKKELSADDVQALVDAGEKIKSVGISDNFTKVIALVPVWHDKELSAPVKESVIAEFGGSDAFKNYIDGEFQNELAMVTGLVRFASTLNNIKSFYARREPKGEGRAKKVKTTQVQIGGDFYAVSSEYLESLAGTPAAEKRELLLAHEHTKKNESIEIL